MHNNHILLYAAKNGHIEIVKRLLAKNGDGSYEFPGVINKITVNNKKSLRTASENGHYEISYILAKARWPNGVKGIPRDLRECIPAIRKGEIIANERDAEATQLFRWLQEGYIPTSRKDLYLPPEMSSCIAEETIRMPFDVMNIVKEYAGIQGSIDTLRPTKAELNMISIRNFQINHQILEIASIKNIDDEQQEVEADNYLPTLSHCIIM